MDKVTYPIDFDNKKEPKSKLEDFKIWVRNNPYLIDEVKNNTYTWQSLYETWYLYGDSYFKAPNTQKEFKFNLKEVLGKINNIDTDKISKTINNVQKVMQIVSSIQTKAPTNVIGGYLDWWE